MHPILESAIVAVLVFIVFIARGGIGPPAFRGKPPRVTTSRLPFKFSVRTLLIVTTIVAVVLGLVALLSR
jgi:hypothetical protein